MQQSPVEEFEVQDYPRPTARHRLLLGLLAVAVALFVTWLITRPVKPVPPEKIPDPPRCSEGRTEHCVGGIAEVIVAPASPSASR